ncbi:MAG: tRNA (N(6)-L-threonylcarbamoyladenosine(37)-C(2))-methylthiotransferase MtaB [Bdellovibrio sp.]|nr:MAG: tRNA (N(6)-L-threonylcarbamoyladenosine(37)-C(2))-methylthiotransferase MtaB [Bdellovibrio sp.]
MDLLKQCHVHTFGCKVNSYDTSLLEKRLAQEEKGESLCSRPVHIFNTCAVTEEATREAVRQIRRLKRQVPHSLVVVTGCGAQVDTEVFVKLPEVDAVVANSHKAHLQSVVKNLLEGEVSQRVLKSNIFKKEDMEPGGGLESRHTRAFLKVQDGCNSFCTFCVIPFARGKSRSLSVDEVVLQVQRLYEDGVREVVITGIHLGDYKDKEFVLEDLVENLLHRTRMPRFRLSSLEPVEVSDRLLELYQEERLCPHFHMSIQSAHSGVLKRMKRQYSQKEVIESLRRLDLKVPGAYVGMDVIVGFPGETRQAFQETYKCLKDLPWTRIHVFPYSERPGTFATRFQDKVDLPEIRQRAFELRELSAWRLQQEAQKQLGKVKKILVLNNKVGLSRDYWNCQLPDLNWDPGKEYEIQLNRLELSRISQGFVFFEGEPCVAN